MSNLTTYKPPLLAVLESHKKMREYSDTERLTISKVLVQDLLNDLGVGKNSDTQHHIRAIKHVSETLGNYTREEIKKAFQMFISHKFKIEVYQQLNSVVIGRVMREYEFYKKEQLKDHRRKEIEMKNQIIIPSQAEQDFIMEEALGRIKKEYAQHGRLDGMVSHIYDWLDSKGKINLTKIEKLEVFEKAKEIARSEIHEPQSLQQHRKIKTVLSGIEKGNSKVVTISKRIVLEQYLNK